MEILKTKTKTLAVYLLLIVCLIGSFITARNIGTTNLLSAAISVQENLIGMKNSKKIGILKYPLVVLSEHTKIYIMIISFFHNDDTENKKTNSNSL